MMKSLFALPLALFLGLFGCSSVTAECHQEADCANVRSDLTCAKVTSGENQGSWCITKPATCTDALNKFCMSTGLVCAEKDGFASCQMADGTKKACDAITCSTGFSCVEVGGQGVCLQTCSNDTGCANEKFCGPHPVATNVNVCLPDLENTKTCNRNAMCLSDNCPIKSGETTGVCTAQPTLMCTGDDLGQGCDITKQFCNSAAKCEDKRPGGSVCQKDTQCLSALCVRTGGQTDGICADSHPTNCGSQSITFSTPGIVCYGLVGQKKGELLIAKDGSTTPAPTGTWDTSGGFAMTGTTVKYCLSDWAPHFNCKVPDTSIPGGSRWLVSAKLNQATGKYDPATMVVDETVWKPAAGTLCRPMISSTGANLLCDGR